MLAAIADSYAAPRIAWWTVLREDLGAAPKYNGIAPKKVLGCPDFAEAANRLNRPIIPLSF